MRGEETSDDRNAKGESNIDAQRVGRKTVVLWVQRTQRGRLLTLLLAIFKNTRSKQGRTLCYRLVENTSCCMRISW